VLRMRVTIEASTAQACNVEAARYLLFMYALIKCALRNISYIAKNFRQGVKFEIERVKSKLTLTNLPSVHIVCFNV
jgi:hypothetical protein